MNQLSKEDQEKMERFKETMNRVKKIMKSKRGKVLDNIRVVAMKAQKEREELKKING